MLNPPTAVSAWSVDPFIALITIGLAVVFYRGTQLLPPTLRRTRTRRSTAFYVSLLVLLLSLAGPVEAWSASLASVHMVQHLLLIMVMAPLFVCSSPLVALRQGIVPLGAVPPGQAMRARPMRARVRHVLSFRNRTANGLVLAAAALHALTLWFWHSGWAYDRAMADAIVHRLEHGTMVITALGFWSLVMTRNARPHIGVRITALFGVGLQSTLLAALLTFARSPWYDSYRDAEYGVTERRGHLAQLADQQLAGAIMWVPGGLVYVAAALVLIQRWLQMSDVGPYRRPSRSFDAGVGHASGPYAAQEPLNPHA